MNVLMAGGGTAGHVNPALAIAGEIRRRHPDANILFIGTEKGIESKLVRQAGYDIRIIDVRGFSRSFSPKGIIHNFGALRRAATASSKAGRIIREFRPDIAIGTGGYVSGPALRRAAKLGVPIAVHEQNAYPGVTNKMLAKDAKCVMLAVEDARKFFDESVHTVVTGNPLRREVLSYTRERARAELGIPEDRMVILSFGGSLGADRINRATAELLAWCHQRGGITCLHATGRSAWEWMPTLLREKGVAPGTSDDVRVSEYINDMPRCMAAADLVICRCGAMTLSELQAQGKASVLIPSPNVTENHQYHNAMTLVRREAAALIEDDKLTGETLIAAVSELLDTPGRLRSMGRKAAETAITDSCERIYAVIDEILSKKNP